MKTVYYVCNGAKLECSEGSATPLLAVARPNVSLCGQPMANIMDHKSANIFSFGLCKSKLNPAVATATAANNGVLKKMPCTPQIALPWANGEKGVTVNGQPAILDTSTCKCVLAPPTGSIEIKDAGQNVVSRGATDSPKPETGAATTAEPTAKTAAEAKPADAEQENADGGDQGAREAAVKVNNEREEPNPSRVLEPVTGNKLSCVKCSGDWTVDDIKKIVPGIKKENVKRHIDGINLTFRDYEINTCLRKIHFLTQILHESGNLMRTLEQLNKKGPNPSYFPFIGRGLIQLTRKKNYIAYGEYVKEDFTSSLEAMEKLENHPHAVKSAGWFWCKFNSKNLNDLADNNDFIYITRIINGGFNGYDDRLEKLKNAFNAIYKECDMKKKINIDYKLKDSGVYNERRGVFAWGLWHDPDLNKKGCVKDKNKAVEGYERLLKLVKGDEIDWYGINTIGSLAFLREGKEGTVNVKKVAEYRLKQLKKGGN